MSDTGRLRIALAWLPAALFMSVIWVASSMRLAGVDVTEFPLQDKGVHFVEFAFLGLLLAHAALRTWPRQPSLRPFLVAVVITCAWGLLDELHQSFVPGRSADPLDLVADSVGAVAGGLFRLAIARFAPRESPEAQS